MRWLASTPKQKPKLGDKREVKKFAFFPVKVCNKWIWWEEYIAVQEWQEYTWYYDDVVEEGLIYERYRTVPVDDEKWFTIEKKLIPETEETIQKIYK